MDGRPSRSGVRGRLQPRAVAARGVARGRQADGGRRRQSRHGRGVLVGAAGAHRGRAGPPLAGRGAGSTARVRLGTVGVFRWALLEPTEGVYDFEGLDEVLDLLHGAGVSVDLATAT